MSEPAHGSAASTSVPANLKVADGPHTAAVEALLKNHLTAELSGRFRHPVSISTMQSDAIAVQTSYPAQVLTLQLDNGETLKIFVKDFSSSILPKEGMANRGSREHGVYRDLLAGLNTGAAHYYGAVHKPGQEGFYLLIEFVEGVWLKYREFDDWVRAAAWLGGLHGSFLHRQTDLAAADFLMRHDADFFRSKAAAAQEAVAHFSAAQAARLNHILQGFDEVITAMTSQPATLVHGSFRTQNILVTQEARVCPVDWELAATGCGLLDLAYIAQGYAPAQRDILLDAYLQRRGQGGRSQLDKGDAGYLLRCFLLYKVIKSLGDSVALNFSASIVDKFLHMAEAARLALDEQ